MNPVLSFGGHLLLKGKKMKTIVWIAVGGVAAYIIYKNCCADQGSTSSSVLDSNSGSSFAAPAPAGPQQSVGVDPVSAPVAAAAEVKLPPNVVPIIKQPVAIARISLTPTRAFSRTTHWLHE